MALVVFNQKGGVGKSTIACNLAAISAAQGQRTLLIDLDSQGNATRYLLGAPVGDAQPTVAQFFEQTLSFTFHPQPPTAFVVRTPFAGLDLMAASPALDELLPKLESRHKIYKLREALAQLAPEYSRIYIDTPPALNFYTRSALMGASGCLIPFDCDDFSRQALYGLLAHVQEIRADHNPALALRGIVVNQYQVRAQLPQRLVQELRDEGLPVLEPYLPASVKVRESHQRARPMIHLEPRHKLTQAFVALHDRLHAGA
ncbi:ParA family protein [Tepidimonas charontis]|uniref:Chromosome partitioning protein ParA n=1 Tax=Tepidimonas charontis TaxID=2267262 RepID=A0A554XIE7_9BURK|nr:ParA family protein [Tepidimonas charontis]TSE35600.1 Chromosome partitioning protein ParA [Tepidimonas charontis]